MKIGEAVELLKQGRAVARKGWNGSGMCIYLTSFRSSQRGAFDIAPFVMLRSAQGSHVAFTWSQTDVLGEDWEDLGSADIVVR